MRIAICAALLLVLAACGGRSANPIASYQPGDEKRSCDGLRMEVANNEQEIAKLLPYEDATGKNVALGVTGFFLIIPLFFMDFKDAEEIEIRALRKRNQWLREVASNKDCSLPPSKYKFQDKPPAKIEEGVQPKCSDVGGYEAYNKRTGRVCIL